MAYDSERTVADFRQQAAFAESLHRKNTRYLDASPQARAINDEIVAVWGVYDYLAQSGSVLLRQRLLSELAHMHAGERPDRTIAPIFEETRFSAHRGKLIANLRQRFEAEADQGDR